MPSSPLSAGRLDNEIAMLRESSSLLSIMTDFAVALLRLKTAEDVLWYTANEVVGKMGFEDCVIYLWHPELKRLRQFTAYGAKQARGGPVKNKLSLKLGEGIVGRAAQSRETVVINDLSRDPNYVVDLKKAGSELAIPIIHSGQLLGVIDSEHSKAHSYTEEHVKILTAVTSMVAAKLAQAQLIAQLESSISELEYAKKLQGVLFNIAALSYEDDNFFKVYEKIHLLIAELLCAKSFFVAVYDPENRRIEFPYFVDERHPELAADTGPVDHEMRGMSAWVIFNNRPLLVRHDDIIARSQRGDFDLLGTVAQSWLGVPIHVGDDLKAAIVVQSYSPKVAYSDKDLELLSFVAAHIANLLTQKIADKKLQHLALHDPLTDLANRVLFIDRVSCALRRNDYQDRCLCAVLYMDVDLFKSVNDRYGHTIGDALLIQFAHLLERQVNEYDTVARLGGDEFAVFLEAIPHQDVAIQLAKRIIKALHKVLQAEGVSILCSTSIGIAFAYNGGMTATEIIRQSDVAMYQAKEAGRGRLQIYDPLLDRANVRGLELGDDILTALTTHQFELHYQPVLRISNETVLGFEALIRWQHPVRSWIPPNEFIDYAEKHRLIEKIDQYVLRAAMQQMSRWREELGVVPPVSVNISGRHFASHEFVELVLTLLAEFQLPPYALGIEITETAVIDQFSIAQNNIHVLRQHQVRILLDDFGTGYSSLNYLHQLTIDVIKIDRAFVKGSRGSKQENPIINSIVALANAMGLTVIAEGVENKEELQVLRDAACDSCQGFYYSKALPAPQAIAFFMKHSAAPVGKEK